MHCCCVFCFALAGLFLWCYVESRDFWVELQDERSLDWVTIQTFLYRSWVEISWLGHGSKSSELTDEWKISGLGQVRSGKQSKTYLCCMCCHVQLVFVCLFSDNTSSRLQTLAIDFVYHMCLKYALLLFVQISCMHLLFVIHSVELSSNATMLKANVN